MEEEVVGTESDDTWKLSSRFPCDASMSLPLSPVIRNFDSEGLVFHWRSAIYTEVNPEGWQKWRSSLNAIGGSDWASILGHGYKTPRKTLRACLGLEEKEKENYFARKAMNHGIEWESVAKECIIRRMEDRGLSTRHYANYSTTFDVTRRNKKPGSLTFCASPDLHFIESDQIMEIKCPHYKKDEHATSDDFMRSWISSVPTEGKIAYFIQVAFYHWLMDPQSTVTYVVCCFINDVITPATVSLCVYRYRILPEVKEFFERKTQQLIEVDPALYRVTIKEKEEFRRLFEKCFISASYFPDTYEYSIDGTLQKQSKDKRGDNDPSVPGE